MLSFLLKALINSIGSFLAYHLIKENLSIEDKILMSHKITKNVLKYRGAIIPKSKMKF